MSDSLNKNKNKNDPNNEPKEIDVVGRHYECRDVDTRNFISVPISQRNIPSSTMETAHILRTLHQLENVLCQWLIVEKSQSKIK